MVKNVTIDRDVKLVSNIDLLKLVDLTDYGKYHIPNYQTIEEVPAKDIEYFNNLKYAGNCKNMFAFMSGITTLDLSKFDTKYVTDMSGMFSVCGLQELNINGFDTSKVQNMSYMFKFSLYLNTIYCENGLDLTSCKNVYQMFFALENTPINLHLKNVPRSLLDTNGSLKDADGTLNETYIIDNILEDK